jgi:hypothetical protein
LDPLHKNDQAYGVSTVQSVCHKKYVSQTISSPKFAIILGRWRPQMRDLALIPHVGSRWQTREGWIVLSKINYDG